MKALATGTQPPAHLVEAGAAVAAADARQPAEHAEVDLEAMAGLKDASHRARGSRGLSFKADAKREAAVAKRREQSRLSRGGSRR